MKRRERSNEATRVHHAARRRGGVAARGTGAAAREGLPYWLSVCDLPVGVIPTNFNSHEPLRDHPILHGLVVGAGACPWQRHSVRCRWLSLPHLSHIPFHLEAGEPFHIAREINACSHT